MESNSGTVSELFFNPQHVGEATGPNFIGRSRSFECGAILRITLHIDDSQRIAEAKFKAAGCSVLVAAASLLIDDVIGKTTGDAAAMAHRFDKLKKNLGALPSERNECVLLPCEAMVSPLRSYS